ncbi:hypothetical protein Ancab_021830 [Ancistrocladus abbreviatus]
MGAKTYSQEIESPVAAGRMFKALCLDIHLLPKLMPETIKTIEFLQGDATSAGSIRQINYAEGIRFKYSKQRIDEVDVNNCYCKQTTIEGGVLDEGYEYIVVEFKIDTKGSGSVFKINTHFHPLPGSELHEEGAVVKMNRETGPMMLKTVEEYLLANPQAFA